MGVREFSDKYINKATVSLIHPLVIPDLFLKIEDLAPDFHFLGSATEYSQYYIDLETTTGIRAKFPRPIEIPSVGQLQPLKKRHTLNSFWRSFRLQIKIEKSQGKNPKELFLFLPLEINIPVEPMRANNRNFKAALRFYLFPFGSCVANLDIQIDNLPIADFVDCVRRLRGSTIKGTSMKNVMSFKPLSLKIARDISNALFANDTAFPFRVHTMLFVEESYPELSNVSDLHKKAIKAAMEGKKIEDVWPETPQDVNEYFEPTSEEGKKSRVTLRSSGKLGEILFFRPKSSFFYKSPPWKDKTGPICMKNNFKSFLVFLFAINRSLAFLLQKDKNSFPEERLLELKGALQLAFPQGIPSLYYPRNNFSDVAKSIGLSDAFKEAIVKW